MANTKSKKSTKKSTSKPKAVATKSEQTVQAKTAAVETAKPVAVAQNPFKGFFARKCDANENILTDLGCTYWRARRYDVLDNVDVYTRCLSATLRLNWHYRYHYGCLCLLWCKP